MVNNMQIEKLAENALLDCLGEVPALKTQRLGQRSLNPRPEITPDIIIKVEFARGETFVIGECKSSGEPRFARQAVNALFRITSKLSRAYGVFLAPYISPSSAKICKEMGMGYVDLAGNCLITFDNVYISRSGQPNPFAEKRDLRSLYSPKAERVLRVLLSNPQRAWKTRPLAQEAQVSLGQVSNVRKKLTDREWLVENSNGILLSKPEALIGEWSQNYNPRRNTVSDFYSMMEIGDLENAIANACNKQDIMYGFTGFSAAARIAPSVRYQRVSVYMNNGIEKIAQELGLKKVDSGANISILEPYDEGVCYGGQNIDGVQLVSPVQTYLDLQGYKGRGEEAAAFLLETGIRPSWQDAVNTRKRR